jgi:8-oxo-dGTP pyrophosphatase MutT (NUDIX family)
VTPDQPLRQAATVVLLRDSDAGPEAYLLRRATSMAAFAGMYVFPGGGVDPRDADEVPWVGPAPSAWASAFSADEALTRALVCAAVRETFEESGVLLAGPTPESVVEDTTDAGWEDERLALIDRRTALRELLERRGLVLRADLLRPWAHWITPVTEPRRFDTRFLVAALPAGQRTREVGGEADRVTWMRPSAAVEGFFAGQLAMLPPTLTTLQELSPYATVADVLAARRHITPILPTMVGDGTAARAVLPDGAEVPMPGSTQPGSTQPGSTQPGSSPRP